MHSPFQSARNRDAHHCGTSPSGPRGIFGKLRHPLQGRRSHFS
ncbi:hypothetical protein BVG79_00023 [Ketogulonicigenium robustum]|uniref:Uncharacterized protein n=1 Tax=Ketogulonicigenium robustum TaxID=92947 RepID=A0A1W6NVZ5_9RHOB|nr:hypothetical protein BVG79_00023 [Ketogulonicigenium robustum]